MLNKCLEIAESLDQRYGGMASVGVRYNPYEAKWIAKADWSSGQLFSATSDEDPVDALTDLFCILCKVKNGWQQ